MFTLLKSFNERTCSYHLALICPNTNSVIRGNSSSYNEFLYFGYFEESFNIIHIDVTLRSMEETIFFLRQNKKYKIYEYDDKSMDIDADNIKKYLKKPSVDEFLNMFVVQFEKDSLAQDQTYVMSVTFKSMIGGVVYEEDFSVKALYDKKKQFFNLSNDSGSDFYDSLLWYAIKSFLEFKWLIDSYCDKLIEKIQDVALEAYKTRS